MLQIQEQENDRWSEVTRLEHLELGDLIQMSVQVPYGRASTVWKWWHPVTRIDNDRSVVYVGVTVGGRNDANFYRFYNHRWVKKTTVVDYKADQVADDEEDLL